jgi:hypothetical protein
MITLKNPQLISFCKNNNFMSQEEVETCFVGFLLSLKNNKQSIYSQYITDFPKDVSWYSLNYKGEEAELASQTFALEFIKDRQSKIGSLREKLRAVGLEFTNEEFDNALANKRTRTFSVGEGGTAMGPYADMVNTNIDSKLNGSWDVDEVSHDLTFTTRKDVKKGEELFIPYLEKDWSNSGFINWGFTLEEESKDYKIENAFVYSKEKKPCHKVHLSFPAKIETYEIEKFSNCFPNKKSHKELEETSLNKIKSSIENRLKKYSTRISEDLKKIKNPKLSYNMRNILRVIIEDKKCLISNLKLINKKLRKNSNQ